MIKPAASVHAVAVSEDKIGWVPTVVTIDRRGRTRRERVGQSCSTLNEAFTIAAKVVHERRRRQPQPKPKVSRRTHMYASD